MNWFKRTNKNEGKKSENKSTPNNEIQKEIESKERKSESEIGRASCRERV